MESDTFLPWDLPFLFASRFHTPGSLFQGDRVSCSLGLAVFGGSDLPNYCALFHACPASVGDHSLFSMSLIQCPLYPLGVSTLCSMSIMMEFWVNLFPGVCNFHAQLIFLFYNLASE